MCLKGLTNQFKALLDDTTCACDLQVLLVSSSRHPDKWIVPGGGMEPEEEPSVAAAREVCEEVGFLYIALYFFMPCSCCPVLTS